jgi:sucrose phosphorylase
VILITETNVPHGENVSYFGDGADKRHPADKQHPFDEAQMVYQFPLPPLVLHALHTGDASHLSNWAAGLSVPSDSVTFFNFLASHDGIGLRPVERILSSTEVEALVDRTLTHGGYVSYKDNPDGTRSVYELNISYFDALSDPNGAEPLDVQARRFLASQAIMLSLAGVPGIYVHSLFGSRSYHAGVKQTGRYRSINREKFRRDELERALADPTSLRHRVFYPYLHLIRTHVAHRAFHPNGAQRVLGGDETGSEPLFALVRAAPDGGERVLCVHNVSDDEQPFSVNLSSLSFSRPDRVRDLITSAVFPVDGAGNLSLRVAPYQVLWLEEEAV